MSMPKREEWTDAQSVVVSALLGILLRADAQQIADDTPGGITCVTYTVQPEGRRLAVEATIHGPDGIPIGGYTL